MPRIADPLDFALASRVLLLKHAASGVPVDVSLGALPFEETAIQRAKVVFLGERQIPVPTPGDLIVMKAIANRPRDMSDIATVLDAHPGLDTDEALATVRSFADALEQPEILDDLVKLLARATRALTKTGAGLKAPRK